MIKSVDIHRERSSSRLRPGRPRLNDYGFIADCHSAALVSRSGSIDWCCMPRMDSSSCFDSLLSDGSGGFCRIAPLAAFRAERRYVGDTLVLETMFRTRTGRARLRDCFTMTRGGRRKPHQQILRVLDVLSGEVEFGLTVAPRFDYGAVRPWIRSYRKRHFAAFGGKDGLVISGDWPLELRGQHRLEARCRLRSGEKRRLSILYRTPESIDAGEVEVPGLRDLDRRLRETTEWWRSWSARGCAPGGPDNEIIRRSALVLKGLTNAPTGAIAAAATTSLPESPGRARNWDYRFSWIRDSCFSVRALVELGHLAEADGFRRFIERSAAGSAEEIQILFGVGGERRLYEYEIPELPGYRRSRPVRVGNAASTQRQLDVYGELLDLAWRWHEAGCTPSPDYWRFLSGLVNDACRLWKRPDQGIWEMRGKPRHFVLSKAMCWVAVDRGLRLVETSGHGGPVGEWKAARDEIRKAVERRGYDRKRGIFTQVFDRPRTDASLLLLPIYGFVAFDDPRMVRTVQAIREDLEVSGFLRRYAPLSDGLRGREGAFLACSFWLAECLAREGRPGEARKVLRRALSAANDLGLFSEEFDPRRGEMLGNFPQGLSHLSLISAALAIASAEKDPPGGKGPAGAGSGNP
jgi:GH15 family glucan-1,4-alpha-glucosidase